VTTSDRSTRGVKILTD